MLLRVHDGIRAVSVRTRIDFRSTQRFGAGLDSQQLFPKDFDPLRDLIVGLLHPARDQIDDAEEQQHLPNGGDQQAGWP